MDLAYGSEIAKLVNEGVAIKSNKLSNYEFKYPQMDDAMKQIANNSPGFINEVRALLGWHIQTAQIKKNTEYKKFDKRVLLVIFFSGFFLLVRWFD